MCLRIIGIMDLRINWNNIDVWIKRIMYLTIMMINNISETILFVVFCIAAKKCSYIVLLL